MTTPPHANASPQRIAIIGGGAAGFFAAITAAEAAPTAQVTLYERSQHTLSKVKISGGGRCNVTHNCLDPAKMATHYPRGARELRSAFHRWQAQDTIQWFADRGVPLKTESDGRMFPETDDSQTIIDCFLHSAREAGVRLQIGVGLHSLKPDASGGFVLELSDQTMARADAVCICTGALKTSPLTQTLESLGHRIAPLAPSLFAFNVSDARTEGLAGLSVQNACVQLVPRPAAGSAGRSRQPSPQNGPLLITHRGFSGPVILRLSAWEARRLQATQYQFEIAINWLGQANVAQLREQFTKLRKHKGRNLVRSKVFDSIPRRLWERIVESAGIDAHTPWSQLSKKLESTLIDELVAARFQVQGKSTNKLKVKDALVAKGMKKEVPAEFVTAGGISRKEIDFRTMQSKVLQGLYFAGECIDIDGITGGFNFQACWTGARLAGLAMAGQASAS